MTKTDNSMQQLKIQTLAGVISGLLVAGILGIIGIVNFFPIPTPTSTNLPVTNTLTPFVATVPTAFLTPKSNFPLNFGGGKIVFQSTHHDGQWDIYTIDLNTLVIDPSTLAIDPNTLTIDRLTNRGGQHPAWSKDGEQIAFMSYRDDPDRNRNSEIYKMNANGSGQVRLTNDNAPDDEPTWSPDGEYIAFHSDRSGHGDIYRMNSDGTNLINLTQHAAFDYGPSWSPNGDKIAFTSDRDRSRHIYIMDTNGSNVLCVTCKTALGDHSMPAWSPFGDRIAFQGDVAPYDAYYINLDGTGLMTLSNPQDPKDVKDVEPTWSPDGKYIAFTSRIGNDREICIISIEKGQKICIPKNVGVDANPYWFWP